MIVSNINKEYAQFVAKAIGIKPEVYPYYDSEEKNSIDILNLEDPIDSKVIIYSTIGLSDFPNEIEIKDSDKLNVPIELLMTGYKEYNNIANILSSCSFYIQKNLWESQPGTIFKNMVSDYYPNYEMKHIIFIRPFLWGDKLSNLKFGNREINCLLCVPISENEFKFKQNNNQSDLERLLFEKMDIDIYNLERKSVI